MDKVSQTVRRIIADRVRGVKEEDISSASTLESLGADSLDRIEVLMFIEDVFEFTINDEDLLRLKTVGDLIDYIELKV